MIGFKVTITPPGGSATDYTSYVQTVKVTWPATTDLPTCDVVFNNQSGIFASLPIFGNINIQFPVPYTPPASPSTGTFGYIFPFYIPIQTEQSVYDQLIALKSGYPNLPMIVILNPSPAPPSFIQAYQDYIPKLQAVGIQVLGYVNSSNGGLPLNTLQVQALIESWYNTYTEVKNGQTVPAVDGIFFDQMINSGQGAYYTELSVYAKSLASGKITIGNAGTGITIDEFGIMDIVVDYEDYGVPAPSLLQQRMISGKASQWGAIAHDQALDPGSSYLGQISPYVGWFFSTDAHEPSPYNVLPSYISTTLGELAAFGVSTPNPPGLLNFNFYYENPTFNFKTSTGGGKNIGHTMELIGTAAIEMLYLTEGNMSVIGTDLPAFDYTGNNPYTPYPSTYVANLQANLLDIGIALKTLFVLGQPAQKTGYRGRLGYDATGMGVPAETGINYPNYALGYYVKGMWSVGQGSRGAQQTGLDIVRNLCTKNVIDGSGVPITLDFYVDPTIAPTPYLTILKRGSIDSGQSFTVGVDPVQDLSLPVDTKDIYNFIVYWANPETQYPAGGDAWSNYPVGSSAFSDAWSNAGSGVSLLSSANTPTGTGSSNEYLGQLNEASSTLSTFVFAPNGFSNMNPIRDIASFNFQYYMNYIPLGSYQTVQVILTDTTGQISIGAVQALDPNNPNAWNKASIAYNSGNWTNINGNWNFSETVIGSVAFRINLPDLGSTQAYLLFDQINFTDDWNFSPVTSFNFGAPTGVLLKQGYSAGATSVQVETTAGYVPGGYVYINPGQPNQDLLLLASVSPPYTLTFASPLTQNHNAFEGVLEATHDPNSVAAYGIRIFNFVDYYTTTSDSDASMAITQSLLTQRKGKKSSGTITVSGYANGIGNIKPGSRFKINDAKDVYNVTNAVDTLIDSWIADSIEYDLDANQDGGFKVTYTVEPWYNLSNVVTGTSPDTNALNLYHAYNVTPYGLVQRLFRTTRAFGVQP